MDTNIFTKFIANSLHINVLCVSSEEKGLREFQAANCFNHALQPMYTAEYLSLLIQNAKPDTFYEITDYVDTSLLLFQFDEHYYIVGPYVKTLASDKMLHELLATQGISANIFSQLKLYYSHYPLLDYTHLTNIILAAMRAFYPMTADYNHRLLKGFHEELEEKELISSAENSYMEIIKRYQYENIFLEKIRTGDVKGVTQALHNSASEFVKTSDFSKQAMYANNHEGFAIIRTLARKAAEEGGCPVVQIDAITQEAIQKMNQNHAFSQTSKILSNMILDLTKAVANSKEINKYSLLIKNIVIFIDTNYSRKIDLSTIANESRVSSEHLCRTFKKETGVTITDYITSTRMKKATELLKETTLSVAEISAFVGYADNNYFTKVFKRHYQMTPTEYRNK